jgi:hypothetical protein
MVDSVAKSKLAWPEFLVKPQNTKQSTIRLISLAVPKSPVSLT